MLYLREDLLVEYAAGRKLIWFIWGERNFYGDEYLSEAWLDKAYQKRKHVWRQVVRGERLSTAFDQPKGAL